MILYLTINDNFLLLFLILLCKIFIYERKNEIL